MTAIEKINVLYVDDDDRLSEVIKDLLEFDDFIKVDVCGSVPDAIRKLESKDYDVVVSDYQMPGADGIEFLKKLRSKGLEMPFILFTGKGREEIAIEALNNGAYAYLQKGLDIGVIKVELAHNVREGYRKNKALKDIIASERRGWALLDLMDGPCALLDRSLNVVAANSKLVTLLGDSRGPIIGRSLGDVLPDAIKDKVMSAVETTRSSKIPHSFILLLHGGYSKVQFHPILNGSGELDRIAMLTSDITELVKNEKELRRRLEMEEMISSISSKLLTQTVDGFEHCLESSLRSLGIFLGVQRVFFDVIRTKDDSMLRSKEVNIDGGVMDHLVSNGGHLRLSSFTSILSSGKPVMIGDVDTMPQEVEKEALESYGIRSIMIMPIVISEGELGVLGIIDIVPRGNWSEGDLHSLKVVGDLLSSFVVRSNSDKKAKEGYELIMESERKLRSYLSNLPGMAYTCKNDKDWTMESLSDGCKGLTGYDACELIQGRVTYESMIHKDDRDYVRSEVQKAVAANKPFRMSYRLTTKGGSIKWVEERGRPVLDAAGGLASIEGLIIDIPIAAKSIIPRPGSQVQDPIVSVTREDIVDQVMILNGHLNMLKKSPGEPASADRLEKMSRTLRRIQDNINFTHEYKEDGPSEEGWFVLQTVAEEASSSIWYKKFKVSIELEGFEVFASESMMKRAFIYLIENSAFHGENVSSVKISFCKGGDQMKIIYEDDGKGIPESDKEDIFVRGSGRNTGFGLFLCKEIFGLYGISLVENGHFGCGTRFEMNVPQKRHRPLSGSSIQTLKGNASDDEAAALDGQTVPKVYIQFGK